MKILTIVNDATLGGAQTLLAALHAEWPPEDERLLLVLLGRGELSERYATSFPDVVYLGFPRGSRNVVALRRGAQRVIDRFRPDVIHSNLAQSDLVSLLCAGRGAARVSTIHSSGTLEGRSPENPTVLRLVAALSGRLDVVVASHDSCREYASRVGLPAPAVTIPNGVPIPATTADAASGRTFLSLSRWHPMKGHGDLFRAFARSGLHRDGWTVVCAGQGVTEDDPEVVDELERATGSPEIRAAITLRGPVQDVRPLLDSCGALVISSRYGETYPLVGMEACARAVPVIATDVGGARDFVLDEQLLCRPGQPEDLARAMQDLAVMAHADRQDLGVRSRRTAQERFDIESRRAAYRDTFRRAMDGGPS